MIEEMEAYERALSGMFSVPRSLSDGKPVTGPSPAERVLMMEFMADCVKQRGQPEFLGCYELGEEVNPYVTYLLCLRPLIEAMAADKGKTVVFAATSGVMDAKAQLNYMSLMVLAPIQFVAWGDLAELDRIPSSSDRSVPSLSRMFIIGDVDFEPENKLQQMRSSDGIVAHEETLGRVSYWARRANMDMLLFHCKGWVSAIDLGSLKNVERKSGCFIATACYDSAEHPAVHVLRRFRDEKLARHRIGRLLIRFYERLSPPVAKKIQSRRWARRLVRRILARPLSQWAARRLG
jgi:hypothetical protein